MPRIKKYAPIVDTHLKYYETLVVDNNPNSEYFKISEFKDTLTAGKNAFLIEGSPYLMETTEIKIEILDVEGNPIYFEPGQGIPQYYEGTSKVVAVYVYEDTPIGDANITVLGELKSYYDSNNVLVDVPDAWKGVYNVKWQKNFKTNRLLSNEDKVRFYKRPKITIDELVKPLYATVITTVVQSGSVSGTPVTPSQGQSLSGYTLPTYYKLTTDGNTHWTGSIVGNTLELTDLNYFPLGNEVVSSTDLLVTTPYTDTNGNVTSFTGQRYTASFSYLEGTALAASALTGSFAKISLTDLTTFTGDVARVKIFRKSQSDIGDYQFVQEVTLESNELLVNLNSQNSISDYYGIFTQPLLQQYWVTSSNSLVETFNQAYLYDSAKLDNNSGVSQYFFTTQSLSVNNGKEYTLSFNLRLEANTNPNNYIRAFLSGSASGSTNNTFGVEQTITQISSQDILLQKSTVTQNITANTIQNPKLYFEVVGTGWHIANVSFTSAQETAFSPDEITFIQSVPRSLPIETFDYRFEFYDINNNFIPVKVEKQKLFNGGNLQTLNKSFKLNPSSLYFQFDSGSNPVAPTSIAFALTKTLLTSSIVNFTSQSVDFNGNILSGSQYTTGDRIYPGQLSNITGSVPYMTVQHFTGSRSDIEVQYVEITGECEGYTDTAVITRVLDGFGGINYFIKSYNGNEIRNSSTQSLELQAYVVDGVNVVNLNSTSIKGRSNYKLHVLSGSKYITLTNASSSGFLIGLATGSLGTGELDYNAIFTRDTLKAQLNKQLAVYLIPTSSLTSASIVATTLLTDLQDGLGTGFLNYTTEHFTIQPRTQTVFTPVSASATASFYIRGANTQAVSASIYVYPSMSIDLDYQPHYYLYYTTFSLDPHVTITAIDDNKNLIGPGSASTYYLTSESRHLNITFNYTEPYTTSSVSVSKTWQIVPEGKPGDDTIVFEATPANLSLNSNAKGVVSTYTPADTTIKLKQGAKYLAFTQSQSPGSFNLVYASGSNINTGSYNYNDTSSFIMKNMSNLSQLSASITYDFEIHPYFTSSYYTQSFTQTITKAVDGAPPVQIIITPANVTLSANQTGIIKDYGIANTVIQLKEGSDYLVFTGSKKPGTFQTSSLIPYTNSHINVSTLTSSLLDNTKLIVSGFNGMDSPSGSITYNFTVYPYSLLPGHTTGSVSLSGTQNFVRTLDGQGARSLSVASTSTTVNFDGDGAVVSPQGSIFLTATPFNFTGSVYYRFYKDGYAYSTIQTSPTLEIPSSDATSAGQTSVWKVDARDGASVLPPVTFSEVTIQGLKSGGDSYNVVLTNENASIVYKVSGATTFAGTATTIRAYKGGTELTPVSAYTNQTYSINGDYIGSVGEFSASIDSKSSYITLPSTTVTGNPAVMGDITGWGYPQTNPTGYVVYKIDVEDGRATFYKTESISVQYEGNTGPGVVMRGKWQNDLNYIGSVETTNYRRDAVIWSTGSGTHYYAAVSGSGPAGVGYQQPDNHPAYWQYLGEQEFFVAAKIAIFDESYVKNTINVGTYADTSKFANVIIAGGRTDPYIAIGQHGTYGTGGSGYSPTDPAIIGYGQEGIYLGIYEYAATNGTSGRFSISNNGGTKALLWDGDTLTIRGSIRQTAAGVPEGRVLGPWVTGYAYLQNDIVTNAGRTWTCTNAHTSGASTEPFVGASYASYWTLAADAGTSGTAGTAGSGGVNGSPGAAGPGVVFRGPYTGSKVYYKSSTRTDAVSWTADGSNYWLTNNASLNNLSGSSWGTPAASNGNWISFGAEFSSIATGTIISEQSYVKETLNVGTNTAGSEANISIVGGTATPYISIGQPLHGYNRPGIFLGNSAGDYRMSMSGSAGFFKWNGSNLELSGNITATAGSIGDWIVAGSLLESKNTNIQLDGTNESIQVFDSGGALRFSADTGTSLPNISAGGATSIYLPSISLSKSTTDGTGPPSDDASPYFVTEFHETTFVPSTTGKYIFKTTLDPASYYTNYARGYGSGYAALYLSLEVWTGPNGTGTYKGSSGTYYITGYGSIDYSGGGGGYISVTGDTLITLGDGSTVMAKNIRTGDYISSWDWRNNFNKFIANPVTGIKSRKVNTIYKVKAGGYEVKVSDSHGFWLDNNTEILVGDLVAGKTEIYIESENSIKKVLVDSVEIINGEVDVYTLEVAGTNNYISNNILSHNSYGAGGYYFNESIAYVGTKLYTAQANLSSGTTYYVTHRIQYVVNADNTSGEPWYLSSTASIYYVLSSKTITVELVSSGVVANGGGFQAVSSDARYIRLTTDATEYSAGGAASNQTYGVALKGALNLKDGAIISDTSQIPGWGPAVKAFCKLVYNGGTGGAAAEANYSILGAYNVASITLNNTYKTYRMNFTGTAGIGTANYTTVVSVSNYDYTTNNLTNMPMTCYQDATYCIWRNKLLNGNADWINQSVIGGFAGFAVFCN
jgi:hypothetical protein